MKVNVPWTPNKAQKKMMREEVNKYLLAADKERHFDTEAMILWALHKYPGTKYGKKRLKRFYMMFNEIHQELRYYYNVKTDDEAAWVIHEELGKIGVDVREWHKESEERRKQK